MMLVNSSVNLAIFGLGSTELIVLAVVIILLFGAAKLPQLGSGIGKGIKNFKKSLKEEDEIDVTPSKEDEVEKKDDAS